MITTKTYYVGTKGLVRVSDDLGANWITKTITGTNTLSLNDVKTDPDDGNKVFVVGESGVGIYGIYVSSNGGTTWNIPTGTYINNPINWNEVTVVDSDIILVCGNGSNVCRSLDGGLTFDLLPQIQQLNDAGGAPGYQDCYSIHFISATQGVVGLKNNTVKTIDAGVTWTPCFGGTGLISNLAVLTGAVKVHGIYVSQNGQVVVAVTESHIIRSLTGGISFSPVYEFQTIRSGVHLTWENDLRLWATASAGLERVHSIDGGLTWLILHYDSQINYGHLAAHFYLNDNGFYSEQNIKIGQESAASLFSTDDAGSTGIQVDQISSPEQKVINAVWTSYIDIPCYRITDCETFTQSFITTTDLSLYVGNYINVCPSDSLMPCGCYYVEVSETCNNPINVTVTANYDTCEDCNMICYKLTDCLLPDHIVITNRDLSSYLNLVVKFTDFPDACWLVELSDICEGHVEITSELTSYQTCVLCLPPVIIPPIPLNVRKVKPGFDTPGCSPEYTVKVNCRWANIVNSEMMVTKYGVQICCSDDDVVKWDIKKELLDLNSIYDPYACATPPEDCPSC